MGEIIYGKFSEKIEFNEDIPESATLLELCFERYVCAIQHQTAFGLAVIAVYFEHEGELHFFIKGDSIETEHLFFWETSVDPKVFNEGDLIADVFFDYLENA
jgi:hypothetical protein